MALPSVLFMRLDQNIFGNENRDDLESENKDISRIRDITNFLEEIRYFSLNNTMADFSEGNDELFGSGLINSFFREENDSLFTNNEENENDNDEVEDLDEGNTDLMILPPYDKVMRSVVLFSTVRKLPSC